MAKRKKTDIVQFKIRLREALRKRLETAAEASQWSLNAEIVRRLEGSFDQEDKSALIDLAKFWMRLAKHRAAKDGVDLNELFPAHVMRPDLFEEGADKKPEDPNAPKSENPAEGMENVFPLKRGAA